MEKQRLKIAKVSKNAEIAKNWKDCINSQERK